MDIRPAREADLPTILAIYNQGIADRIATLETEPKNLAYMTAWLKGREPRHVVLFTFAFNALGQGLYRKKGYREVGTFLEQGVLDDRRVDVMAMEKILGPISPLKETQIQ